jgi:hypothetical protein
MSDFYGYYATRRPAVEDAYNGTLSRLLAGIPAADTAALMQSLQGGKKIRGCLACLVCEGLGGLLEQAMPRAVAVEMIQAATLLHDDVVDQDAVRGGRPAVWTVEGARRTVLIGDVIFAAAIKMMAELSAGDGRAAAGAIALVSRGALEEPLDAPALAEKMASERAAGTLYDEIVRLKTGVLFGAACTLGAIAAGRDGPVAETCRRYGLSVGEAYQIADDLKEVRCCLSVRLIDAARMMAVAPALLRFAPEARPFVLDVLQGGRQDLDRRRRKLLMEAVRLMEEAIERRAQDATDAIEGSFARNGYREIARKAPAEIVAIFNQSP